MPNQKHTRLILIIAICILLAGSFWLPSNPIYTIWNKYKPASAQNYSPAEILDKINIERIKLNLKPLKFQPQLQKAADKKARDMSNKDYFSHISPFDGAKWSDFINNENYDYNTAGENLAKDYDSTDEMISAWMQSPTHRKNIENDSYLDTGISVHKGILSGKKTMIVVQEFGSKS